MVKELVVKALHRDVGESIDRGREHRASVTFEMLREVAAASEEADAHGRLSDDHLEIPILPLLHDLVGLDQLDYAVIE